MPKYYCDYCDTFLTHDSPSVRKTHCGGRKHKENVRFYYQKWVEDQAQNLIDQTTAAFKQGKMPPRGAMVPPPQGGPPGYPQGPMMMPPHPRMAMPGAPPIGPPGTGPPGMGPPGMGPAGLGPLGMPQGQWHNQLYFHVQ
ncbi:U1 small nuclear ribonucleoprotein C [Galendromus occidentalis]|uniref:U1 small nuclear ribonucleoprotein C n=1 Tax=Galendromus occidentalis TaxID=34638 RepID=A0AAJ6VVY7_9ACAR|nr:U1 small nuclear ribonucleoprotein C [Galendromus occidentalis]